jgi:alkyl hydroperoxide reductase subunit AhpC
LQLLTPLPACVPVYLFCVLQPIGRSVDETLRLVQAIQFHAKYGEVSQQ